MRQFGLNRVGSIWVAGLALVAATGMSSSAVADTVTVTFRVPEGASAPQVAVSGIEGVRINDRAQVRFLTGGNAIVATTGSGEMNIGADALVDSLFASDNVVLRDRAYVMGDVQATGQVDYNDTVIVEGTVDEFQSLQFVDYEVVHEYQPSTDDVILEPDQVAAIGPGSYRKVVVKSRAKLYLDPGVYDIAELQIEAQAIVYVSNHEVATELWVRDQLAYQGRFVESAGARRPGNTLVVFTGESSVSLDSSFYGTLYAPNTDVSVAGGTDNVASIHAGTVEVHQGARLQPSLHMNAPLPGADRSFEIHPDDVVGGSGTKDDPYLILRDNPRLTGHFDLLPGERAWGGRDPDNEAYFGWEPAPGRFLVAVLRASYGLELNPDGGAPFVSTLPMIPTGEIDGEVEFDFRGFSLEPGKLYLLEAEVVRDEIDTTKIPGVYPDALQIWVKLAPEVHVYPFLAVQAHWNGSYFTYHDAVQNSILLDYELEMNSNARHSVNAAIPYPFGPRDYTYRDEEELDGHDLHTGGDYHPDDVWAACADLTSNGGLPQLQAIGVATGYLAEAPYCWNIENSIADPLDDPTLSDPVLATLGLGSGSEIPSDVSWFITTGFASDCLDGRLRSGNIAQNPAGLVRQNTLATFFFEKVTGIHPSQAPAGSPFHLDSPGSNFDVDWCLDFESLPDYSESAWSWLDEPPWVVCRFAGASGYPNQGDVTYTTRHRCGALLNGTELDVCPVSDYFESCFELDLTDYYVERSI